MNALASSRRPVRRAVPQRPGAARHTTGRVRPGSPRTSTIRPNRESASHPNEAPTPSVVAGGGRPPQRDRAAGRQARCRSWRRVHHGPVGGAEDAVAVRIAVAPGAAPGAGLDAEVPDVPATPVAYARCVTASQVTRCPRRTGRRSAAADACRAPSRSRSRPFIRPPRRPSPIPSRRDATRIPTAPHATAKRLPKDPVPEDSCPRSVPGRTARHTGESPGGGVARWVAGGPRLPRARAAVRQATTPRARGAERGGLDGTLIGPGLLPGVRMVVLPVRSRELDLTRKRRPAMRRTPDLPSGGPWNRSKNGRSTPRRSSTRRESRERSWSIGEPTSSSPRAIPVRASCTSKRVA